MKLFVLICVVAAIDIAIQGVTEAAPLSTINHLSAQLLESLNSRKHLADEDTDSGIKKCKNDRLKRSSNPYHDYVFTAFRLRSKDWKPNNCNSIYNCEQVSNYHCQSLSAKMFCAESEVVDIRSGCELEFNVYIGDGGEAKGIDFVMFKIDEDFKDVNYYIYLIYKLRPRFYKTASERVVSASCKGWQVFHVKDDFVKRILSGQNKIKLILAVFKENYSQLLPPAVQTCDQIKQTFFIDRTIEFDFGTYASNTSLRQVQNTDNNEVPTVNGMSKSTESTTLQARDNQTEEITTFPENLLTTTEVEEERKEITDQQEIADEIYASKDSSSTLLPTSIPDETTTIEEETQPSNVVTTIPEVMKELNGTLKPTLSTLQPTPMPETTEKENTTEEETQPSNVVTTIPEVVMKEKKGTLKPTLSTLQPTSMPEITRTEILTPPTDDMTFSYEKFLPLVTLFVDGEKSPITLPSTTTSSQTYT